MTLEVRGWRQDEKSEDIKRKETETCLSYVTVLISGAGHAKCTFMLSQAAILQYHCVRKIEGWFQWVFCLHFWPFWPIFLTLRERVSHVIINEVDFRTLTTTFYPLSNIKCCCMVAKLNFRGEYHWGYTTNCVAHWIPLDGLFLYFVRTFMTLVIAWLYL